MYFVFVAQRGLDKSILMNNTDYMRRGFTLVELLIVIGLLGAISLIVIAAINPIEQANRARDARFRADGGQIISAVERYFASRSSFPWEGCAGASCTTTSEEAFGFVSASDNAVGLCSGANCAAAGILVTGDELKSEFIARDFIKATAVDKKVFIGKGQGSSASVYACYIPLSKAARDTAITNLKIRSLSFDANGIPSANSACTTANDNWGQSGCYVCIPE